MTPSGDESGGAAAAGGGTGGSWLRRLYGRLVLGRPLVSLLVILAVLAVLTVQSRHMRLDASAESLILEHDEDLAYYRELAERYGSSEFLLVTFRPADGDVASQDSLARIRRLRDELGELPRVTNVVSVLDIPLLLSPPVPIGELADELNTIATPGIDMSLARRELSTSPMFRDLLVSPDLSTAGVYVFLEPDAELRRLLSLRGPLLEKERLGSLTAEEETELDGLTEAFKRRRLAVNRVQHEGVAAVREVLSRHRDGAELFLGGVPMIADDMMAFVREDMRVFGVGILFFLVVMLGVIFRRKRWVVLPLLCCALSATSTLGVLALFGWEVTVISSNFVSLQLVLTMAVTIHLVVRYNELRQGEPAGDHRSQVLETVASMVRPCFYTSITTIAGFCSLMVCDILPVINFGWMMTVGIVISLVVTFLLFPSALALMPPPSRVPERQCGDAFTVRSADLVRRAPWVVWLAAAVIAVATIAGISRLAVENCFIGYFRDSTEIYQGMVVIDQQLGGTTPLDITVEFPPPPPAAAGGGDKPADPGGGDVFDEFEEFDEFDEFEDEGTDAATYWYTREKIDTIRRVHDYVDALPETGKVFSLWTILHIAEELNGGRELDSFDLALLFRKLPEKYEDVLVAPYVSVEDNQVRVNIRLRDSRPDLRRNELLERVATGLRDEVGLAPDRFRLAGVMVLYNNMLQSLFTSQIKTIGVTLGALLLMFLLLFRSFRLALIAIVPNLLASSTVLGIMGLAGIPLDMMTITIVAISIGIAVDDTIHYIHRFRHEFALDPNYRRTMYRCHGTIGNAMYYTSVTITVGFSILVFSNFIPTVLFGLLTAAAMVVALLGALTLLPLIILVVKPFGPQTSP